VDDDEAPLRANQATGDDLSDLSREINEELERIESLVKEYSVPC
jgi:hypothetical protein